MTPAETITADCRELAILWDALPNALQRDNTGAGRFGRLEHGLSLFNTDVLYAKNRLTYEIPAAAIRCCQLLNEPWRTRTIDACLLAFPRWAARMHDLGMATELHHLEALTGSWRRQTKRALGLRTPDLPLGAHCPLCDPPAGDLFLAGYEARINPRDLTAPPRWDDHDRRVYCTHCGAVWGRGEWGLLEQQIAGQQVTA